MNFKICMEQFTACTQRSVFPGQIHHAVKCLHGLAVATTHTHTQKKKLYQQQLYFKCVINCKRTKIISSSNVQNRICISQKHVHVRGLH